MGVGVGWVLWLTLLPLYEKGRRMSEQQHDQEHGEFRALTGLLSKFLSNDAPHIQRAIGSLEGRLTLVLASMGALATLTVAVLVRLLMFS